MNEKLEDICLDISSLLSLVVISVPAAGEPHVDPFHSFVRASVDTMNVTWHQLLSADGDVRCITGVPTIW